MILIIIIELNKGKTMKLLKVLAVSASLFLVNNAYAHHYWVEPNEFYFYGAGDSDDHSTGHLTFEFTGGDTFFNADVNRAKNDLDSYRFQILNKEGATHPILTTWSGVNRAVFEAELTQKGTYALEVERTGAPMYYTELKNGHYIPKAADELSTKEQEQKVKSVGYYQSVKAYTTFGEMSGNWKKPLGHTLEIIPLSHPNSVYAGDDFKVQVLFDAKPLSDATLDVIYQNYRAKEDDVMPKTVVTDKNGIAEITFDSPNRYLIAANHQFSVVGDTKAEGLDYRASLMLQVNEPWVKTLE